MKKSYLMIAAAAALFAACSSNDTFKEIDTLETAITFNQGLYKTTRASIGSVANLATEGGFDVYGYKTTDNWTTDGKFQEIFGSTVSNVNVGVQVYYENSAWKYDHLRFWDKNAKYNFYAVAPHGPESGTYTIDKTRGSNTFGMITISNAASNKYSASDDYLIDRDGATDILGSDHTGTSNAAVDIDFHHIMAKVTFALKSTLTSGTITVTNLTMAGWNNATGTFVQAATQTPTSIECSEWTLATPAVPGNVTLVGSGAGNNNVSLTCSANATATTLSDWYIMIPQAIAANALTFTVSYTYNDGNGYTETFTDQVATVADAKTWGTDSYTNYTLDIKPAEIKFNVTSICGFDVNGGNVDTTVE